MGVLLNRRRYMGASKQAETLFEMYNQDFDGTANSVVDTGLKLWDGTHNRWKMEAVFQKLTGQASLTTLFAVRPDVSPYSGIRNRYGGSGNDFELTISDSWNIIKNDGGFQTYVLATYGNALRKNAPLDYDSLTIIRDGNILFIDYNGYTVTILITDPKTNNLNLLIGCDYKGANNETQRYYTGTIQKFVIKELPSADELIMTSITNPEVLAVCYAQGWCADANYMTKAEAEVVTSIGTVFRGNTSITHFEELQYFGITGLANSTFYDCSNLRQVTLKENLRFGGRVFQNAGLTSIVIPYGVTFSNNDFSNCTSLVSIQLYDGLVNMPDLGGCTSLIRVDVPSSVRGYTSVRSDTSLVYINCPEGVTSIPAQCFRDCSSLPSVELPSTITSIGESAFRSMRSLSSFIIHAVTPPTLGANNVFNTTCMFYVPAESVEAYKTASGWSGFADRIQAIPT